MKRNPYLLLLEAAFWIVAFASTLVLQHYHLLFSQIAILGLFALSLDLILGYAGIVSLGHAAFLGMGAYTAGLLAKHVTGDPLLGLAAAAVTSAALGWLTSFLILRGSDLTRLMVTLGVASLLYEAVNSLSWLTGGADSLQGMVVGPVLGWFPFDLVGTTAHVYALTVLFVLTLIARRIVRSPFGLSLKAINANALRASAVGVPVSRRLIAVYTLSAAYAGVAGGLMAQTTQLVSLDFLEFHRSAEVMVVLIIGGTGYLYGGILGAIAFSLAHEWLAAITSQYWMFWIGLILVIYTLIGRERMTGGLAALFTRKALAENGTTHSTSVPGTTAP